MGLRRDPELDYLLTQALELHDESLCECGCGHYADVCQSDEADGMVRIVDDEVVCHVRAALDEYRADEGRRPEPGALLRIRWLPDYQPASVQRREGTCG